MNFLRNLRVMLLLYYRLHRRFLWMMVGLTVLSLLIFIPPLWYLSFDAAMNFVNIDKERKFYDNRRLIFWILHFLMQLVFTIHLGLVFSRKSPQAWLVRVPLAESVRTFAAPLLLISFALMNTLLFWPLWSRFQIETNWPWIGTFVCIPLLTYAVVRSIRNQVYAISAGVLTSFLLNIASATIAHHISRSPASPLNVFFGYSPITYLSAYLLVTVGLFSLVERNRSIGRLARWISVPLLATLIYLAVTVYREIWSQPEFLQARVFYASIIHQKDIERSVEQANEFQSIKGSSSEVNSAFKTFEQFYKAGLTLTLKPVPVIQSSEYKAYLEHSLNSLGDRSAPQFSFLIPYQPGTNTFFYFTKSLEETIRTGILKDSSDTARWKKQGWMVYREAAHAASLNYYSSALLLGSLRIWIDEILRDSSLSSEIAIQSAAHKEFKEAVSGWDHHYPVTFLSSRVLKDRDKLITREIKMSIAIRPGLLALVEKITQKYYPDLIQPVEKKHPHGP